MIGYVMGLDMSAQNMIIMDHHSDTKRLSWNTKLPHRNERP
jgi:hypothetical protein